MFIIFSENTLLAINCQTRHGFWIIVAIHKTRVVEHACNINCYWQGKSILKLSLSGMGFRGMIWEISSMFMEEMTAVILKFSDMLVTVRMLNTKKPAGDFLGIFFVWTSPIFELRKKILNWSPLPNNFVTLLLSNVLFQLLTYFRKHHVNIQSISNFSILKPCKMFWLTV